MFKYARMIVGGLALVAGLVTLDVWKSRPGGAAAAAMPEDWPSTSRLMPAWGAHHLIAFVHPRCPSSQDTLAHLQQIVESARTPLAVSIVFVRPTAGESNLEQSALWRQASNIPGAQVTADTDRAEANRFGCATSGQVVLFSPQGRLVFSGGITAAPGHEAINVGQDAILSILQRKSAASHTPVYGCPLFEKSEPTETGNTACQS